MPANKQKCPDCGGEMTDGFAAVSLDGTTTPLFWVEGHPERVAITRGATTKGRKRRAVEVMRCRECGYLKAYAPE